MARPDEGFEALQTWVDAVEIMTSCVVRSTYRVPLDLVAPLVFTPEGEDLRSRLCGKYRRTREAEASLAVAMAIGTGEHEYVDALASDLPAVRESLTRQIRSKQIFFPDTFDPELAKEIERRDPGVRALSHTQTMQVISDRPTGVFQAGRWIVGPWGCVEATQRREMYPRRHILGYLCEDPKCKQIHPYALQTGVTAISKARDQVHQIIGGESGFHSGGSALRFRREASLRARRHLLETPSLLNFICDALADHEVASMAAEALRSGLRSAPELRTHYSGLAGRVLADPREFVHAVSRNENVQLLHTFSDGSLIRALDQCIASQEIKTDAEVPRSARVERWPSPSGSVVAGQQGLSIRVKDRGSQESLGRLLQQIYADRPEGAAELAYLLGQPEADLDELISFALNRLSPAEVVEKALQQDLATARLVQEALHLSSQNGRDQLGALILWRLGEPSMQSSDPGTFLTSLIDDYLARSTSRPEEAKRGDLSNIFVNLETFLARVACFARWALTVDHAASAEGFLFEPWRLPGLETIESTGKPTLSDLAAAFNRLSNELTSVEPEPRAPWGVPRYCHESGRPYAFSNIRPFDNLSRPSQGELVSLLRKASKQIVTQVVLDVRNFGPSHGNVTFPSDEQIAGALRLVRETVLDLSTAGLSGAVFIRTLRHVESGGRQRDVYAFAGNQTELMRPFWPVAQGLPAGQERLVIVPAAVGPGWGPLRFRLSEGDRGRGRWRDWPPSRKEETSLTEWGTVDPVQEQTDLESTAG